MWFCLMMVYLIATERPIAYLLVPDPPAPPTNIRVTNISSCSIRVEWVWPQTPPTNDVASPDYAVFEVNLIGESHWTAIGRADITRTSLDVRIPSSGLDTRFQLRAKCASDSVGDGAYFTVDDMYTLYSQGKEGTGGEIWHGGEGGKEGGRGEEKERHSFAHVQ